MIQGELPTPPAQSQPWLPLGRADLPVELVETARTLFWQGLADPRGLPYHTVEITTGSVWGGTERTSTHGWVLPATGTQRFAVTWAGLVYPVLSVGATADVRADMLAVLDGKAATAARRRGPSFGAAAEAQAIAHDAPRALSVVLLLRLGETELAARLHAQLSKARRGSGPLYEQLASDWLWSLFDRAVCAHMRGDDRLALASARQADRLRPIVDKELVLRAGGTGPKADQARRMLGFLDPVRVLVADLERRRKDPIASLTPDEAKKELVRIKAHPDRGQRISRLVGLLEQVSARQMGQPGGVELASDPIVVALRHEGEAAVEALLDVLERDGRLTRSVHFWRDFSRHRSLMGVHEAAYVALAGLLDASFFEIASTGDSLSARGAAGRAQVAGRIRAYWQRWKGFAPHERWYKILADDTLRPDLWIRAGQNLIQPVDVVVNPGSTFGSGMVITPARQPGSKPTLRGAAARTLGPPTVSALLGRRARDQAGLPNPTALRRACTLAFILDEWDPAGSRAVLDEVSRAVEGTLIAAQPSQRQAGLLTCAANLALLRRERGGGDRSLDAFASLLADADPKQLGWDALRVLRPLWERPRHRALSRVAARLFGKGSSWRKLLRGESGGSLNPSDAIGSPLLRVDAFRAAVLDALADPRVIGEVTFGEKGQVSIKVGAGWSTSTTLRGQPLRASGSEPLRVGDYVAWGLTQRSTDPATFRLDWDRPARDRALAQLAAKLRRSPETFLRERP